MRVRFTSPHPKDFGDDCLDAIAAHTNICRHLHMPAQSGSSTVLARMRRGYTRDAYDALIERARAVLPGATFSTDIIVGFCGETDPEHRATLDLLERTAFSQGFLFAYSRRERTHAARKYADDVPAAVKSARLAEAMAVYKAGALQRRRELAGTSQLVRRVACACIVNPALSEIRYIGCCGFACICAMRCSRQEPAFIQFRLRGDCRC